MARKKSAAPPPVPPDPAGQPAPASAPAPQPPPAAPTPAAPAAAAPARPRGLASLVAAPLRPVRAWLVKRLRGGRTPSSSPPDESEPRVPLLDPVPRGAEAADTPYAGRELDEDDARLLPFVFLHRSRMHAVDLRRELDDITGKDGLLLLGNRHVTDVDSYRMEVAMQVAVEVELEGEASRRRLAADPEFRRLVHDALYYPAWRWRRGEVVLDLGDQGIAAFVDYLESRMDPVLPASEGSPPALDAGAPRLAQRDIGFLLDRARGVAELLASRDALLAAFKDGWTGYADADEENSRVKKIVDDLLRRDLGRPALLLETGEHVYRWLNDTTGATIPIVGAPIVEAAAQPAQWSDDAAFIHAVESALVDFMGAPQKTSPFAALTTRLHVLGSSPTWSAASGALGRLQAPEEPGSQPEPALPGDAKLVSDFAELLRRNGETLGLALFCGTALGTFASGGARERLEAGLAVAADAHRLAMMDEDAVRERLRRLVAELGQAIPALPRFVPLPAVRTAAEVPGWQRRVHEQLEGMYEVRLDARAVEAQALEAARARVAHLITTRQVAEPGIAELLAAPLPVRALRLLRFNLAEMSAGDWSNLGYEALVPERIDSWFGFAALAVLGVPVPGWEELWRWLKANGFLKQAEDDTPPGLPFPPPRHDAGVLLLVRRGGPSSLADRWPVVADLPAVLLREVEVNAILGRFRKAPKEWLPGLRVSTLAFEMPQEKDGSDLAMQKKLQSRFRVVPMDHYRVVYVYPQAPTDGAREPYIFSPRSLRDLRAEPVPPPA